MEYNKLNDFEITYAAEKDLSVHRFVVGNRLADLLNEKLKISDYSDTVTTLFVIYQCFAPDNEYIKTEAFLRYRRKTKVIELHLLMDYNKVKEATETEMKQMFIELYKSAIPKYLNRKDFDAAKFSSDFKSIAEKYYEDLPTSVGLGNVK